ncbi:MAG: hypothetical protein MSE70_05200 [Streptococcus sp.]|uniref:hypothetical protein n=1 Tax=Streptococcus sp. TaxID=1306 RepID=UPI00258E9939|nr:hypothetical protein [Streptococcus sp.]MCI7516451.1 hypothetical protein [Streptococcus sp.]
MIDNMKDIKALLAHLPYRASFYDNNLKLIYSNHRSDGSFFTENESEKLPEWIWQSLHQSPEKSLIAIGKPLVSPPRAFPPLHTVRDSFPSHGVPPTKSYFLVPI